MAIEKGPFVDYLPIRTVTFHPYFELPERTAVIENSYILCSETYVYNMCSNIWDSEEKGHEWLAHAFVLVYRISSMYSIIQY